MGPSKSGRDPAVLAGRITRGAIAVAALAVCSLAALFVLTLSCCSSPGMGERLSEPFLWGAVASYGPALAAFPPLSKRLRGTRWRHLLWPLVLASLAFSVGVVAQSGEGILSPWTLSMSLPPAICAIYTLTRVLLARAEARPT